MSSQTPLPKTPITRGELVGTIAAMLALTTIFVFSRVAVQISRRKSFELQDFSIYFAYIIYIALWSVYLAVIPPMFRVYAVIGREIPPYKELIQDAAMMLRLLTAGQMCFYSMLFAVKISLLSLYRKLLAGLPSIYHKIWWGTLVFCVVAWIGSVLSSIFTCNNLKEKFTKGKCAGTANETKRIIFSLYFAYAVDVATNLAIMFLPIRLTWNLQMQQLQKIGVFILFGSGFVCIAFATLRVTQLGVDGRGRTTTPEPKWMVFWTVMECTIAIIIGCCPAFAVFIRKRFNSSKKASHNANGYVKQPKDEEIKMTSVVSSTSRPKRVNKDPYWNEDHSSQEELAANNRRIVETNITRQDNEQVSNITRP
ncbi:hypothetical protein GQ44DRAFT_603720 [Phaeosphaeriaceae sp. PMI808]|nr:hypothetical protein GQ44DRAFT_603720 [Phaeosphaeriaceae sp. PMI808]